MAKAGFPVSLLAEEGSARLSYFRQFVIAHPRLKEIDATLWSTILEPAGVSLVFVYGPTGVGKTTLRRHLESRLKEEGCGRPEEHHLAVVGVDAIPPDAGHFAWRDFYRRTLKELEQPFLPESANQAPIGVYRDRFGEIVYNSHLQQHELRQAVEQSLRHRQPCALLIDEAQHIAKVASGRRLQDQVDCLKFLAQQSRTLMVLIGTYELQSLRNLSGQLSRRSRHLHFSRYGTSAEDLKVFRSIIYNLQLHLPVMRPPNLIKHWEYLYARSIGCTGILKDWLVRCLAAAIVDKSQTITLKRLQEYALPASQCERIATEAIEGERYFTDEEESSRRLMGLLGLNAGTGATVSQQPEPTTITPRVIERKPRRDKIG